MKYLFDSQGKHIANFVKNQLKLEVNFLITCGKSINRTGSAYLKLKERFPKSKLEEIWVSRVEEKIKQIEKQKATNQIITLLQI